MAPMNIPRSKRIFDIVITCISLVIFLPIMGIIALLVWIQFGRPVIFRQERGGYLGKVFKVFKFRSMTDAKDEAGNLLPDAERLTTFGKFLRASSLDELPELFNILRGEMSLVGPRPLYAHYLERYSAEQARRHLVLPGLTGWAQVNGRNALTWEEKFKLDVWYVDHWSLGLDLRILALTIIKWLKREGISQPGHVTADEFYPENRSHTINDNNLLDGLPQVDETCHSKSGSPSNNQPPDHLSPLTNKSRS